MMGSLTTCIKKSGKKLNKEDKAVILQKTREFRTAGDTSSLSATKAITHQITNLQQILTNQELLKSNHLSEISAKAVLKTKIVSIVKEILNVSKEKTITKAKMFTVTLTFEELLCRFFGVYGSDAEVLARLLGFEQEKEDDDSGSSWEEYIQEKVDKFAIIEKAYNTKDFSVEKDITPAEIGVLAKAVADYEEYTVKLKALSNKLPTIEKSKANSAIPLMKSVDELKREVVFLMYEPDVPDSDGNWASIPTLRKACQDFNAALELGEISPNLFHSKDEEGNVIATDSFVIQKSWIAESDCYYGETRDELITEGSWLVKVKMLNDTLWDYFQDRTICGVSIGCKALHDEVI